jgi:hypothetical protein
MTRATILISVGGSTASRFIVPLLRAVYKPPLAKDERSATTSRHMPGVMRIHDGLHPPAR